MYDNLRKDFNLQGTVTGRIKTRNWPEIPCINKSNRPKSISPMQAKFNRLFEEDPITDEVSRMLRDVEGLRISNLRKNIDESYEELGFTPIEEGPGGGPNFCYADAERAAFRHIGVSRSFFKDFVPVVCNCSKCLMKGKRRLYETIKKSFNQIALNHQYGASISYGKKEKDIT